MAGPTESSTTSPAAKEPLPLFAWPPPGLREQPTVVNVEGAAANDASAGSSVPPSGSGSVYGRLFPPAGGFEPGEGVVDPRGVQIQQYTIEDRLGVGGMGSVFLAEDTVLQRPVALKVLSPHYARDEAAVRRFRNEARAAARLDHENITRVFNVGEEQGLHFIAYEYVEGTNLRDLIRAEGPLHVEDALNFTIQLASALAHTAEAGVVHRDIKPSNVIITPSRRAKLVDLGLARHDWLDQSADLTVAGTTLGTFDYISPEQARDPRSVDVRSDIYSLGCTLYHMLTGEPPYPQGTVFQKLLDHNGGEPPDPAAKNRRVPAAVSALTKKMMASDRRRRYQTPEELLEDLLKLAARLGLQPMPVKSVIWAPPAPLRQRFWEQHIGWVVTLTTLVLLVVLLEFFPGFTLPSGAGNPPVGVPAATNARPPSDRGARLPVDEQTSLTADASTLRELTPIHGDSSDSSAVPLPKAGFQRGEFSLAAGELGDLENASDDSVAALDVSPSGNQRLFDDSDLSIIATDVGDGRRGGRPIPGSERPRQESGIGPEEIADDNTTEPQDARRTEEDTGRDDQVATAAPSVKEDLKPPKADDAVMLVGEGGYPTLEAACTQAPDGSVIELRYDGSRGVLEKPIVIANKSLTVRAAPDVRPIVEFDASLVADDSPALVTLDGGSLTLIGLDLVATGLTGEPLSLFKLEGCRSLRLQRTTVTLESDIADGSAVIAVRSKAANDFGPMKMPSMDEPPHELEIEVVDSVIRSNATFLAPQGRDLVRSRLRNSAFVLGESLFREFGTEDEVRPELTHEIDLHGSTVITGKPTFQVRDDGDYSLQLVPLHVSTRDCIYSVVADHPLVEIQGSDDVKSLLAMFTWDGERNFYDSRTALAVVGSSSGATAISLDYDAWVEHWNGTEMSSNNDRIDWDYPHDELDAPRAELSWFALDEQIEDNPPVGAASDGSDAGVDVDQLPSPPNLRPAAE